MPSVDSITGIGDVSQATTADKTLKDKVKSYHVNDASSLKEDTLSLQNKVSKNKKGLIIGAAAALGIAAGVIYGVKTGKLQGLIENIKGNKVQKEGKEILKESKGVLDEAKNTVDEVTDLLKKGQENGFNEVKDENGNIIRRFLDAEDDISLNSNKVMEEFDAFGIIKRRTNFNSDDLKISTIKEYIDAAGKKYDEITLIRGLADDVIAGKIKKGVEEFGNGSRKVKKSFLFKGNDKLLSYSKNVEGSKFAKSFVFNNDGSKVIQYMENGKVAVAPYTLDDTLEIKKLLAFDNNGKLLTM